MQTTSHIEHTTMNSLKHVIFLSSVLCFLFLEVGFNNSCNAQNIAGGYWHTLSLCTDGTVSSWGANYEGQLGTGNNLPSSSPVAVSGLTDVIAIGCGRNHSMALKSDSTLWVWGWNEYGQLGNGEQINNNLPVQVPGLSGVKAMDGSIHTIVLKGDSTVWTWGYNAWGQMGTGVASNTPTLSPIQVPGLSGIIAVEAAFERSMALKKDSTVWAWGTGFYGALGNGFDNGDYSPEQVPDLTEVIEIATSDLNSYALKVDGTVWACGYNEAGAVGDGTYNDANYPIQIPGLSDIISIDDGGSFAIFLKNDGTVWTVGDNYFGQLGIGSDISNSNTVVQVTTLSDIVAIEAGTFQCFATKSDGTVWAWGWNNENQLGNIEGIEINEPVQVMGICAPVINVNENDITDSIIIYPNPATDQLFIRSNNNESGNISNLRMFDQTGQLVWQSTNVTGNFTKQVDTSNFAEGVYLCIFQNEEKIWSEQFVVVR